MSNNANIVDRLMLSSGLIQQDDGKYTAVIHISNIARAGDAEQVVDWAVKVLGNAFAGPDTLPNGTVRKITPVED